MMKHILHDCSRAQEKPTATKNLTAGLLINWSKMKALGWPERKVLPMIWPFDQVIFFYSAFAFNKICGFFLFVQFFIFIRPWKKGLHPVKVINFIVISFVFGFLTYVWMRLNARIFLEAGSRRPCWKYWAQERVVLEMFLMKYVSSYFIFFERNSQTIISD